VDDPGPILGIDLGTTHSVVAVLRDGKVEVIPNQEGQPFTPSVVAFTESGEILVGARAQRRAVGDPRRTVYSVKRLLGRTSNETRQWADRYSCEVVSGPLGTPELVIDGRRYTPVEVVASLLASLKEAAERHLGHPARRAVVTVPAFFTDAQRQAVLAGAEAAGFDVDWVLKDPRTGHTIYQRMRIISEPTAAALALGRGLAGRLAVVHVGGGTFDVTLLDAGEGVLQVKAVGGDTALGGDDFDQLLVDHLLGQFSSEARDRVRRDPVARQRLRLAAEQAKRDLSQSSAVSLNLPWLADGVVGLCRTVTRAELERLVQPLIDRCRRLVQDTLADAGWQGKAVDQVLLIGGMTRMPRLRDALRELFPGTVHRAAAGDEVVAVGAAVQGQQLLLGSRSEFLVVDAAPLTLGLETAAGEFVPLIPRNVTIPVARTQAFTTAVPGQPGVSVRVFQEGDRSAGGRKFLGQLDLAGLDGSPGQTRVEVTFDLDHNGILRVSAKDQASGKERTVRMVPRLPAGLLRARQQVHHRIADLERLLEERAHRLDPADQEPLRQLIERGRVAARKEDVGVVRQALEELASARDALVRYLDGTEGAAAPSPFVRDRRPEPPAWEGNLEI
jgi:molecular chaperone DnaK